MATSVGSITQELTQFEIEEAGRYLAQARDDVFAVTEGLSEAQWSYRPTCGGWSAAGIVEHMVIIQELILGPIAEELANSPEHISFESQTIDHIIKTKIPDRSRKFPAPESV